MGDYHAKRWQRQPRRQNMNIRRLRVRWHRSTVIGAVLALAVALVVTGATLAAGASGGPTKQDYLKQTQDAYATMAAGPHAPKPSMVPNAPQAPSLPSSCPRSPIPTGIGPGGPTPFHADATYTSAAGAISSAGDFYYIWAGALRSDPQQGVLIVLVDDRDPCKVSHGQAPSHAGLHTYPSPSHGGALTLTQIVGDRVAFSVADGSHGSFNFVTEQYLSS